MTTRTWSVDKIVVGSCLRSVLYAQINDCPLIYNGSSPPYFFDEGFEMWNQRMFRLGLLGKIPFSDRVKSLRVRGESITVIHGGNHSAKILFKKCYVFDNNCLDLENEVIEKGQEKLKVVDWINLKKCVKFETDEIRSKDDFVNRIVLYESGRLDSDLRHKDVVVVSYLSEGQLLDFEFSDTMCRFKTRRALEENGIMGTVNRIDKKTGKVFRNRIDLNVTSRDVIKVGLDRYEPSSLVEFPTTSLDVLLVQARD
ncbi:MAG: hypothetical protein HOJ16_06255 [Candidatus Peribacter sp.]|jgi:hypothetical protein|nr:hypothetical protein [Candidatus Peribacter sp.]